MKSAQLVAEIIGVILMCNFEFYDIWVRMKALKTWPGLNVLNVWGKLALVERRQALSNVQSNPNLFVCACENGNL